MDVPVDLRQKHSEKHSGKVFKVVFPVCLLSPLSFITFHIIIIDVMDIFTSCYVYDLSMVYPVLVLNLHQYPV